MQQNSVARRRPRTMHGITDGHEFIHVRVAVTTVHLAALLFHCATVSNTSGQARQRDASLEKKGVATSPDPGSVVKAREAAMDTGRETAGKAIFRHNNNARKKNPMRSYAHFPTKQSAVEPSAS